MKNKAEQWYLGFFGLFALNAVPGILEGEWSQAVWLVWVVWFLFFFKKPIKNSDRDGSDDTAA